MLRLSFVTIGFIAALLAGGAPKDPDHPWQPPGVFERAVFAAVLPLQSSESSCGYSVAAALINVASTADCLARIRAGASPGERGGELLQDDVSLYKKMMKPPPISLGDIRALLEGDGVDAQAFLVRSSELATLTVQAPLPVVLHLREKFQHFVLAIDVRGEAMLVFDPARGITICSVPEIAAHASGYCLVPGIAKKNECREEMRVMRDALWSIAF